MAAERRRRGPAPIASFDHDVSDESSPESKQTFTLPEIKEQAVAGPPADTLSVTLVGAPGGAGGTPRIDISRASSSSHQDSRDSSPEEEPRALGFREDGALDLRSSTEELAFLEGAPGPTPAPPAPAPPGAPGPPGAPAPPAPRRHSRKDSQGSEAALLLVSGRTSRLSSIGSACSAVSHVSRLSAVSAASGVSGVSRSPSPHKMLLETSFCGPKPIENDPDMCTAMVEERLLQLEKQLSPVTGAPTTSDAADAAVGAAGTVDARDRREVRTEVTVEPARPAARPAPQPVPLPTPLITIASEKQEKETRNQAQVEERRSRPRSRRDAKPEVYKSRNRSKDIIRIKLKPDDDNDNDDDETEEESEVRVGAELARAARPTELAHARRSPSPAAAAVSRKSSFCSLFKSREAVNSPESPGGARRRSRSGEARRSHGVLALFRRGGGDPPAPAPPAPPPPPPLPHVPPPPHAEKLKYYEPARDGIIHIPLHSPPADASPPAPAPGAPLARTVLPDGSILIPLHSPPERTPAPVSAGHSPPPTDSRPPERIRPESAPARTALEQQHLSHAAPPAPPAPSPAAPPTPPPPPSPPRPPQSPGAPTSPPPPSSPAAPAPSGSRRTRLVFSTHVGSAEQVFSTQLSLTQTPSVTSDLSETLPFPESEAPLRDTHIGPCPPEDPLSARDSSSEGSAGATPSGWEPEQRGLVVQESFEDELPYVPTTLPLERSVVVPMVPVRSRIHHTTASVERPRGAAPGPRALGPRALPAPPAPPAPAGPNPADKLLIRLPRRPKTVAQNTTITSTVKTPPEVPEAARAPAGPPAAPPARPSWVAFEEAGRRRPARRIQTVEPAPPASPPRLYASPDRCRCECHHHHTHTEESERRSESDPESTPGEPFTGDLQLSAETHTHAQLILHPATASSPPH